MLTIVLVVLAVLVIGFLLVAALQPADYRVVRAAKIVASPETVFDQINDFRNWKEWSPWAKRDPKAKNTFEGPVAGTGANFRWAGNRGVGEGSMTIVESRPIERIRIQLNFLKPFQCSSVAEFTFTAEGNQTLVTWSMTGRNNFLARAIGLVLNMDKMIGGDFEAGLANLRSLAESASKNREALLQYGYALPDHS